jgi:hypothetical protein
VKQSEKTRHLYGKIKIIPFKERFSDKSDFTGNQRENYQVVNT